MRVLIKDKNDNACLIEATKVYIEGNKVVVCNSEESYYCEDRKLLEEFNTFIWNAQDDKCINLYKFKFKLRSLEQALNELTNSEELSALAGISSILNA